MIKIITLLAFFTFIYTLNWNDDDVQYLIYTDSRLEESAINLSNLYEIDLPENEKLKTKIVIKDTLSKPINEFLANQNFNDLIYLCIIGDESIIDPVIYNGIPCDACLSSFNLAPNPSLITGRILASNNNQANVIINNSRQYMLSPYPGDWKSELLLFCDDQYKIGKTIIEERQHTINSNIIYDELKNNMNIKCLYGPMFNRINSSNWYIQPDFNQSLIQNINKGVGLINYIGHGTSEFLADENILTYSDIDFISIENNKLPIWIAGTCSFGNYLNERCFAEKILNKGNAGIAVISTTGNLSYESTYYFIEKILSDKLKKILTGESNHSTIGELFYSAIQELSLNYNKASLHLFGDPALKLNLSKTVNQDIINPINLITVGIQNSITVDNNNLYSIRILGEDIISQIIYDNTENNFQFNYNGETLFYGDNTTVTTYNDYINFILPLDAYPNNVDIKIYQEESNSIQCINNIILQPPSSDDILDDNSGPIITVYQNNSQLNTDSSIYEPYNLTLQFEDISPINISNTFSRNIKLWIDDNYQILEGFIPTYYGGYINCYIDANHISKLSHTLEVEAWDVLNNRGFISYKLNFINSNESIYNVYNFPNPFKDKTYFTFGYKNSEPITAKVKIFTLNGKEIYSNSIYLDSNNEHFYKFSWDGNDNFNNKIPNGIYLYHLEITKNDNSIHKGIYKIAKI